MDKALEQSQPSARSNLQYVSLLVGGRTYGGWYRVLPDGQIELLALANIHSERRAERTPADQARGMLAEFVRSAGNAERADDRDSTDDTPGCSRPSDGQGQTLAALLYADSTTHPVPEREWLELMHGIGSRDYTAMRDLYERTHRIVFTLLMRLTNDRTTAEELTVDVFHEVWRRAPSYDPEVESVVAWIMNQARSLAVDYLTFDGRTAAPASSSDEIAGSHRCVPAPQSSLVQALETLTPGERQAIETTFFCQLGYADAAARLQQSIDTVKTNIRGGLEKLQRALQPGVKAR